MTLAECNLPSLSLSILIWKMEMIIGPTSQGNHRDPERFWKHRALHCTRQRESAQRMAFIINIRKGERGSHCLQYSALYYHYFDTCGFCTFHISSIWVFWLQCSLSSWYSCVRRMQEPWQFCPFYWWRTCWKGCQGHDPSGRPQTGEFGLVWFSLPSPGPCSLPSPPAILLHPAQRGLWGGRKAVQG